MHLTSILMKKFLPKKLPAGNIWRGKYRLVRKVTAADLKNVQRHLEIEEKNMFYLRHPYLKAKEYKGVGKDFFHVEENFWKKITDRREAQFMKSEEHRKIENHYPPIVNHNNPWE